jgi:3-carboxy-cis,cis-muconate cycloisomerase
MPPIVEGPLGRLTSMSPSPELGLLGMFGDDEVAGIFSLDARMRAYLDVEVALALSQAELGTIPASAATAIAEAAASLTIDPARLASGTRLVGYPILPLLQQLREAGGPEVAAYLHWGATTQDIMDSGLALQLSRGIDHIAAALARLGDLLVRMAAAERATIMTGRTHAQPAVPTTWGAKVAVWAAEYRRHLERLRAARERACVVSLFGAGGTAAALGPLSAETRAAVARRLGLGTADVPWHVARDGLFEVGSVLTGIAATGGKIGREVIELSRPEIGEVAEVAGHHRGASSTMPQKANPITSELLVACQALAGAQLTALVTATQGLHERAAGEWQVEWDAMPLLSGYAATSVSAATELLAGLHLDRARMAANVRLGGDVIMAEAAMMALAPVVGRGRAHDIVYAACRRIGDDAPDLATALQGELDLETLERLPPLPDLLDPRSYLGEADAIVDAAITAWTAAAADDGAARPSE